MKFFEPTEKRTTIAVYAFLVALFCVVCVMVGMNIKAILKLLVFLFEIVKPIIYGFIIAFLFHPLVRFIETRILGNRKEKKAGFRHFLSVLIAYGVVLALIVLFCITVIPQILDNYDGLERQFWEYIEIFRNKTAEFVNSTSNSESIYLYYETSAEYRKELSDNLFAVTLRNFDGVQYAAKSTSVILEVRDIFDDILTAVGELISSSVPNLFDSAVAVVTETKNIIIGIFISLYFLLGEKKHIKRISFVFKAWLPKKAYDTLAWLLGKAKNIFRNYIVVRLLDGVIIGLLMYVCLFVLRVGEYRVFLSVLIGVASFFPFIGAVFGISAGTVLMLFVDVQSALIYLIVAVVLNLLDSRYIEPLLNSGRNEYALPAIWVFAAIVIMGGFFGVVGILIGIPLFAFIYSIIKELSEKKLLKIKLSADTRDYFAVETSKNKQNSTADDALDMRTYYDERREAELENADTAKKAVSKLTGVFKRKKKKSVESPERDKTEDDSSDKNKD